MAMPEIKPLCCRCSFRGSIVWPFYTVQFPTTPSTGCGGHGDAARRLSAIISGLDDRKKLAQCDAVLSGYLGDKRHCEEVMHAVTTIRQRNPQALYFAIGDGRPAKGYIIAQGVKSFCR